jgi:hypothetical protein
MIAHPVTVRHPHARRKRDQGEDRQQMDRAPRADQPDLMDPERATATEAIRPTQIQPSVPWGKVPFGAASCTTPSTKAAIAANA